MVGQVDEGAAVLWDILNPERILLAASALGGAEVALRVAVAYAKEREVFGRPIGANQAIAFPLAQVKAKIELARLMIYKAAWSFDQRLPCGTEANIAKLTASQAAWEAADARVPDATAAWRTHWNTPLPDCSPTPGSGRSHL